MPQLLRPSSHEQGRATAHLNNLLHDTRNAWRIGLRLIEALDSADLDRPSRVRGRTVREVLLPVGTWPQSHSMAKMVEAAQQGNTTTPPRSLIDSDIRHHHFAAEKAQIVQSWQQTLIDIEQWESSGAAAEQALLPVGGPLGVVPLATLVGASAFQLAVAVRDAGLNEPGSGAYTDDVLRLQRYGLHALTDSAGAVCARYTRDQPETEILMLRIVTAPIRVGFGASQGAWRTALLPDPVTQDGPRIDADAGVMIDMAAGRRSPLTAAARREITFADPGGLLTVATALASTPDLPGGDALRAALTATQGARGLGSFIKNKLKR